MARSYSNLYRHKSFYLFFAAFIFVMLLVGCGLKYMYPKTISDQVLSDLKESESIIWGELDDSSVSFVEETNIRVIDPSIANEAKNRKIPVWKRIDTFWMLAGKLDMGAPDRQVELTFANIETGQAIRTLNAAGISSKLPFYVVLPKGQYMLEINLIWPKSFYRAKAKKILTSTGGRNAIYIGHIHMGIKDRSSYTLFDNGDFTSARNFFRSNNPKFKGHMSEQRIAEEVILINVTGKKL